MVPESTPSEAVPLRWIEAQDLETDSYSKATWIPLLIARKDVEQGTPGTMGHRHAYCSLDSAIVPIELKNEFESVDWQSLARQNPDSAWADKKSFFPPGIYHDESRVLYPVIQRRFETGEPTQWDLLQELEVGLQLLRKADKWIRPDENDIEVASVDRDCLGEPIALRIRAEHLRDYLCAKQGVLLIVRFNSREAIESDFAGLPWKADTQERKFAHGEWEGTCRPIHEGGHPFNLKATVVRVWRESVDPAADIPEMPHPSNDLEMKSEVSTQTPSGALLHRLYGRIWVKHWIQPASQSPRIRRDTVESTVPFLTDTQESKTLAGSRLLDYRGWLWFRPKVVKLMTEQKKGYLKWYTEMTGQVGPAINRTVHFGVNKSGLINVLGKDIAELPEWAQKLWVGFNVAPEGGISDELHSAQNLARPADTKAPEMMLFYNLSMLRLQTERLYGKPILQRLPSRDLFCVTIHRFYSDSFEEVCVLCKELNRHCVEPIDIGLINDTIDHANAEKANKDKLGSIKRVALWLNTLGVDGRKLTRPLAAIYDLRNSDAHAKSKDAREALTLLGIPRESEDYKRMTKYIITSVNNCIGEIGQLLDRKSTGGEPSAT